MVHATNERLNFFKFKYGISTTCDERSIKRGPSTTITQLDWSGYVDDIVLYLLSLASLQALLPSIEIQTCCQRERNRHHDNSRKYNYKEQNYPSNVISLNENPIKTLINFDIRNCPRPQRDWEVNCRIEAAKNKFSSMKIFLY